MIPRSLLLALAISLLFNVGVLVGWMRPEPRPAKPAPSPASSTSQDPLHDVRLTREQRRRLLLAVGEERSALLPELRGREQLRAALAAEPFDPARARAAAESLVALRSARARRGERALTETVPMLTAEQRREVLARLDAEDYSQPRWRILRSRFDRNGDGRLDAAERAAAAATPP